MSNNKYEYSGDEPHGGGVILVTLLAFSVIGVPLRLIYNHNTKKSEKEIQRSLTKYICSKNGIEYIQYDGRPLVLSVDPDGKPVKCHHE